jgi:signal transduction histidine kinase
VNTENSPAALSRSVLVVEDDADIRESLVGLLCDEGYDARAVSNGFDALEDLRSGHRTDVILLDLMMPVMDGWQFRVRQREDPRIANIPVLVLSADTTAKAAAIDADAYLKKPIDCAALVGSIERTVLAAERRTLQAALVETERLASLGTLAAGVAHEINNPLAYVMANLAYIEKSLATTKQVADGGKLEDALAEARDGCERIRAIVRDLQLLSRAADADDEGVDIRRVLDSSLNIVMPEIRARARLTKAYGDVPLIRASAPRLGQVFLNLLLNAAQAIDEGHVDRNEIRVETRAEDGALVVLVSDTGGGIPPEIRARVFDPFFTTKPIGVGTGLGLSISHRIIAAMGGELTIDARPGPGTTFRVRIPAVRVANSAAVPRSVPSATTHRARVVVLDDEPLIGTMVKRVLSEQHSVEAMTSSDAFLARIARGERFDLVLCDLMMPGKNGMDVYAEVARTDAEQARRMVFLTGGALNGSTKAFVASHASAVIAKPFSIDELCRRIDRTLAELG